MPQIMLLDETETIEYCNCFYNGRLESMKHCYEEAIQGFKKEKNDKWLVFQKQVKVINGLINKRGVL